MSYRLQIALVFLGPVVGFALLFMLALFIIPPLHEPNYVIRLNLSEVRDGLRLPEIDGPNDTVQPLIVIDPGHGGYDPGASGSGMQEKAIVLQLARALRRELLKQGMFRVALTRDDDHFLVVEERFALARDLSAALFVSLHADSAGSESSLGGASVYTLSNEASSEAAARFAARENTDEHVNGTSLNGRDDEVNSILVELSQRKTQERSVELANLIVREGGKNIHFLNQPRRSAALRVLRAPDIPSVLYEAGFISNPKDADQLASVEGQQKVADALARAIRIYFIRHPEQEGAGNEPDRAH